MSYITTMAVGEGVIMTADRQITTTANIDTDAIKKQMPEFSPIADLLNKKIIEMLAKNPFSKPLTKSARKLFTIGDNIGVAMGQTMFTENGLPLSIYVDFFCRTNTFERPKEAAEKLLEYVCRVGGNIDSFIGVAGYDKSNPEALTPEIYRLNIKEKTVSGGPDIAFYYAGANDYFKPFSEKINADKKTLLKYSLQDALNICKLATDMSRGLEKYIDFNQAISDDIEIIAITHSGIKWLKKAELEV